MDFQLGISNKDNVARGLVGEIGNHILCFPAVGDFPKKKRGRPRKNTDNVNTAILKAEDVAEELRAGINEGLKRFLDVGDLLIKKKNEVGYGEFGRLFKNHPQAISAPLPISIKRAQQHMQVARHPLIRRHISQLPSDLDTLVTLSRLPNEAFEAGLADGSINSEISRQNASKLVNKVMKPATATSRAPERSSTQASAKAEPGVMKARLAWWALVDDCRTKEAIHSARQEMARLLTAFQGDGAVSESAA